MRGCHLLLQLDDIHGHRGSVCVGEYAGKKSRYSSGKVSAWLSLAVCCAFKGMLLLFGLP